MARPVRFSEHFKVRRTGKDEWFDPLLNTDTKLYVDPFLIFLDETKEWANAHARLMAFFTKVIDILDDCKFNPDAPAYKKAEGLLLFKEPPEFCLGTSEASIFGAGSASGLQAGMLNGAEEAVRLGHEDLRHFEELAMFGEQIGPDRISDITCDVLKEDFIKYTQRVARRHGIPLVEVNVGTAGWDERFMIWKPGVVELPINPIASAIRGRPIGVILTPKRFLRRMPTIDPSDFWTFAASEAARNLRGNLNVEIGKEIHASQIAKYARQHPKLWKAYLDTVEANPKPPYDVDVDPDLVVRYQDFGRQIAEAINVDKPSTEADFVSFIELLVSNFKNLVENGAAWKNLWVNDKLRPEEHAQILFRTSAVLACQLRDVDISREADAGRGPVDFKMSKGWKRRVLIEVKYAKSSSFQQNLETQTPTYSKADGCDRGWFLVLQSETKHLEKEFVDKVNKRAEQIASEYKMDFRALFVDATPKTSASKVRRKPGLNMP